MKLSLPAKSILFTAVCFAVMSSSTNARTMYRWVDEHGKISFSDQVPPDKAMLGHQELDKNAQVTKVADRAKTKAELEAQKQLELLKQEQDKILAKQQARDKKLLSSFLTLDAMLAIHKAKREALNGQELEIQSTRKKLTEELLAKQQEAAGYEIKNKKIPRQVLNKIEDNQKKIAQLNQDLKRVQQKKLDFEQSSAADKERYLFLTQPKTNASVPASEPQP